MNKIVLEHYPVSKLPEDLKPGFDSDISVTVTIESEAKPARAMSLEEMFALRRDVFGSPQDVNDHVRSMRDEWSN